MYICKYQHALLDKFRYVLWVVAHVCVHQEYEGARGQLQAVDVRTAKAHFPRP